MSTDPSPLRARDDAFAISVDERDGLHVIALAGELDLAAVPALAAALESALPRADAVLVDLDRLSFIDSAGLVAIVRAEKLCEEHGVGFGMTRGSAQCRQLFDLLDVGDKLPFVDWEPETPADAAPPWNARQLRSPR